MMRKTKSKPSETVERLLGESTEYVRSCYKENLVQYREGLEDGKVTIVLREICDTEGNLLPEWKSIVESFYTEEEMREKNYESIVLLPYIITRGGSMKFFRKTDYFLIMGNDIGILREDEVADMYEKLGESTKAENHIIDLKKGYEIAGAGLSMVIESAIRMLIEHKGTSLDIPVMAIEPLDDAEPGGDYSKVKSLYKVVGLGKIGDEEPDAVTLIIKPTELCPDEEDESCDCENHTCCCGEDDEEFAVNEDINIEQDNEGESGIKSGETLESYIDRLFKSTLDELSQTLGIDKDEK